MTHRVLAHGIDFSEEFNWKKFVPLLLLKQLYRQNQISFCQSYHNAFW